MKKIVLLVAPATGVRIFGSDSILSKLSKLSLTLDPKESKKPSQLAASGKNETKANATAEVKDSKDFAKELAKSVESGKDSAKANPETSDKKIAENGKDSAKANPETSDKKIAENGKEKDAPKANDTKLTLAQEKKKDGEEAAVDDNGKPLRKISLNPQKCTNETASNGHAVKIASDAAYLGKPFMAHMTAQIEKPVTNGTFAYTLQGAGYTFHGQGSICGQEKRKLPLSAGDMIFLGAKHAKKEACPIPAGQFDFPVQFSVKEWVVQMTGSFHLQLFDQDNVEIACAHIEGQIS